jgi:hypothetical protein
MFNKLATFASGIVNAIKAFAIQCVAVPAGFVQHVSAVVHDAVLGTMNHIAAAVKAIHGFVATVTNHLTLLVTPAPKPIAMPPQQAAKQAETPKA